MHVEDKTSFRSLVSRRVAESPPATLGNDSAASAPAPLLPSMRRFAVSVSTALPCVTVICIPSPQLLANSAPCSIVRAKLLARLLRDDAVSSRSLKFCSLSANSCPTIPGTPTRTQLWPPLGWGVQAQCCKSVEPDTGHSTVSSTICKGVETDTEHSVLQRGGAPEDLPLISAGTTCTTLLV